MNNPNYQIREVAVCWVCVHSEEDIGEGLVCVKFVQEVEPLGFCPQFQRIEVVKA